MHIVIVGNGPAALGAVEAIRETDGACDITIISPEVEQAYTACFLAAFVSGRVDSGALALKCDDFHERHNVELRVGHAVTAVKPELNAVVLDDGTRVHYDKLLLACGADPVMPKEPDLSGQGIFVFKSLGDAMSIRAHARHVRDIVVLGSGFVAMEIAEALAETGASVRVVARKERILRRMFDPEVARMVEEHMSRNGVHFVKSRELVAVQRDGDTGEIRAVALDGGERLPCDMLVVGIGMRPKVGIVADTPVATDFGILTDSAMQTSVENIYAAGDIAEIEIDGVRKTNLIHPSAVATGKVAGSNMVGVERRMNAHHLEMNVLTVFGRSFLSVGAIDAERVHERISVSTGDLVMVFADGEGVVRGAQLVGDVTRGGLYASVIARQLRLDAVPDLLATTFNYYSTVEAL